MSVKDKLKTSEFWLSLVALIVGLLMAAGIFGDGSVYARIGGILIATLSSMGYTVAESLAKVSLGLGKPGFKTLEFWKAVAAALIAWAGAHLVPEGSKWAEVIAYAATILPVGTYAVARGAVKRADARTELVAVAAAPLLPATPPPSPEASGR